VEAQVWIRFTYLFESPGVEMKVYLSDRAELGDRDPVHVKEVGRLTVPAAGRPGSVGSGRFGRFEQRVSTSGLDLSGGTWVELELVDVNVPGGQAMQVYGPALGQMGRTSTEESGDSMRVDDWSVDVYCTGICMDLNWSTSTDEEDFVLVMASAGHTVGSGAASLYCCEGLFSRDGYIDALDLSSWDWALKDPSRAGNLCGSGMPLSPCTACGATTSPGSPTAAGSGSSWTGLPAGFRGWVVLGKRSGPEVLTDSLYLFGDSGHYDRSLSLGSDRCNIRLVQDRDSHLYLINSETGVLRLELDGSTRCIVPGGIRQWSSDPRYHRAATVSIGIQQQGLSLAGRPVLDAAIVGSSVYLVPVVVSPVGGESYVAAARLDLREGQTFPYELAEVYDDPGLVDVKNLDNPNLSGLREIEVDDTGSVYVLSAHSHNESDVLWKYHADGTVSRVLLGNPRAAVYVPDPTGLCVCGEQKRVYVACGQNDPNDAKSARVYGFSTEDLSLQRRVTLQGMEQVTGMTMEGKSDVLWVVGYTARSPGAPSYEPAMPVSEPYLVQIPPGATQGVATPLAGAAGDLALPTSIIWTGE
jgi:hypothetical protein